MTNMSPKVAARPVRMPGSEKKRHKYNALRTETDGVQFASKKEARRYQELKLLERVGQIREFEMQPTFDLSVTSRGGERVVVGKYTADFRYRHGPKGLLVIEDVKSKATRTTAYRLRKRMVEAIYGITITEV